MMEISERDFAIRQPYFPGKAEGEDFYLQLSRGLFGKIGETAYGASLPEGLIRHLALTLAGYMQDVTADAGLWRSFVTANRELYGYTVPFHAEDEEYVDFELNRNDIRFLCWYDIAMMDMERRALYPHDKGLLEMADILFEYLDARYDDAPIIDKFNIARDLSLTDEEDREPIFHLARWLFNNSWLLTPAYALDLAEIVNSPDVMVDKEGIALYRRIDEAVSQDTTGPLALYITEWVYLMLNGKLPDSVFPNEKKCSDTIHPYYSKFVEATGGKEIAYFATYKEMNEFFIKALGWEKGCEHLGQIKSSRDFVLLVNAEKGMLVARNVARCIADPENMLYDKDYALDHAFDLLTIRGLCPHDLLSYIFAHGWLPDARFPESGNYSLVAENHDFIARCYLQKYYRGD